MYLAGLIRTGKIEVGLAPGRHLLHFSNAALQNLNPTHQILNFGFFDPSGTVCLLIGSSLSLSRVRLEISSHLIFLSRTAGTERVNLTFSSSSRPILR